eukprot:m.515906 g.515906  ORF g.515906 m.515906 type:complete len:168 (+) comp21924_c0_seq10:65-568(+)
MGCCTTVLSRRRRKEQEKQAPNATNSNENAANTELVKAVLVAGLYPNIVKIEMPPPQATRGGRKGSKAAPKPPKLKTRKLWESHAPEEAVQIHPSSVLYSCTTFSQPFLTFHEKVKTSAVYVRDGTVVSPFALLLFGGDIQVRALTALHFCRRNNSPPNRIHPAVLC